MNRQIKFLRSRLGRLIRDITGKIEDHRAWREVFAILWVRPVRSAPSSNASAAGSFTLGTPPEVACIGKGKARAAVRVRCQSLA